MTPPILGLRAQPGATPDLLAALGTVPGLFRLTADRAAPVVWLAGGSTWAAQADAALAAGARLVVLDTSGAVMPDEVARLEGRPVALLGTRTHAPQLRALAGALPGLGAPELVDLLVVDGSDDEPAPAAALWDAVSMLTAAGLDIDAVPAVTRGARATTADATAGTARVHVTCVHRPGTASRAAMKVFTSRGSVAATMGDPRVAAPGAVLVVTAEGTSVADGAYETPRRVALREAHAAVTGSGPLPSTALLDAHAHAARLLGKIAWEHRAAGSSPQPEGTR